MNVLILKKSFTKRYKCGILSAADFGIFLLKLIYYALYRVNNWRFQTYS